MKGERGLNLAAQACRTGGGEEGTTLVAEILDDLFLPMLAHLANEIEKSIAFYASESQGEILDRLILAGGGAQLKNLDAFLSERLGLRVQIVGPEPTDSNPDARETGARVSWPLMAGALGLAMRDSITPERRPRRA